MWSLIIVNYNIKNNEINSHFIGLFDNRELALEIFEKEKENFKKEYLEVDYVINEIKYEMVYE